MPPDSVLAVAAYQRLGIIELRNLYDQIDVDLKHYSDVEMGVEKETILLEDEFAEVRKTLLSLGADLPGPTQNGNLSDEDRPVSTSRAKKYKKIDIENPDNFGELARQARGRLMELGVDLSKDPLLQILNSDEISAITGSYKKKYGDIT